MTPPQSPAEWSSFRSELAQQLHQLSGQEAVDLAAPEQAETAGQLVADYLLALAPRLDHELPLCPTMQAIAGHIDDIATLCAAHNWPQAIAIANFYAAHACGGFDSTLMAHLTDQDLVVHAMHANQVICDPLSPDGLPDHVDAKTFTLDVRRHLIPFVPSEHYEKWFEGCNSAAGQVTAEDPLATRRSAVLLAATALRSLTNHAGVDSFEISSGVIKLVSPDEAPDAFYALVTAIALVQIAMGSPERAAAWWPLIEETAATERTYGTMIHCIAIFEESLYPHELHKELRQTRAKVLQSARTINEELSVGYLTLFTAAAAYAAGDAAEANQLMTGMVDGLGFGPGQVVTGNHMLSLWEQATTLLATTYLALHQPSAAIATLHNRLKIAQDLHSHVTPLDQPHIVIESYAMLCDVHSVAAGDSVKHARSGARWLEQLLTDQSAYMLRAARTIYHSLWRAEFAAKGSQSALIAFDRWEKYLDDALLASHDAEELSTRTFGIEALPPALPVSGERVFWHQAMVQFLLTEGNAPAALVEAEKGLSIASEYCDNPALLLFMSDVVVARYAAGADEDGAFLWQDLIRSGVEADVPPSQLEQFSAKIADRLSDLGRTDTQALVHANHHAVVSPEPSW